MILPTHRRKTNTAQHILSKADLHLLLRRERIRSDRSGREFAFVVFQLNRSEARRCGMDALAKMLHQRLRVTDDVGQLRQDRMGAVLPETNGDGAHQVAEWVRDQYLQEFKSIHHHVFVYPTADDDSAGDTDSRASVQDSALSAATSHDVGPLEPMLVQELPFWKRSIDIAGAAAGLLVSLPILIVAALLIKVTSRGPLLFRQRRTGLGGKPFTIYKLRTMCVDAEAKKSELRRYSEQDGPAFKMQRDPRITKVGRILRQTCIDELPQLWNVLKGDMSLVGPRPLPCDEAAGCRQWQRRRLDVTPGLTCLWQVHGGRQVAFAEWMRMDIRYIKTRTFKQDFKLLWKTAFAVLFRRASC